MYRTAPLKGLFSHLKGGFYRDGRFPDLRSVVEATTTAMTASQRLRRIRKNGFIERGIDHAHCHHSALHLLDRIDRPEAIPAESQRRSRLLAHGISLQVHHRAPGRTNRRTLGSRHRSPGGLTPRGPPLLPSTEEIEVLELIHGGLPSTDGRRMTRKVGESSANMVYAMHDEAHHRPTTQIINPLRELRAPPTPPLPPPSPSLQGTPDGGS